MSKVEVHNDVGDGGTAPCFATPTEIEVAEHLRHQLEKRLLAPSTPPPPLLGRSSGATQGADAPDTCYP